MKRRTKPWMKKLKAKTLPIIVPPIRTKDQDLIPDEWRQFFQEMHNWVDLPKEQILQILLEANLSYLELEEICNIINHNLEHEHEISDGFGRLFRYLGDIICGFDPISNFFWETKTKRDFSKYTDSKKKSSDWKSDYEGYLKMLEEDLTEAIKNKNIDKVVELLDFGVDPSADDNYAIRWASEYGHTEIVKML